MSVDTIDYAKKELGEASSYPEEQKWTYVNGNEVKDVVNNHAENIEQNILDISANASNISTNASNISANASNIAQEVLARQSGDEGTVSIHADVDLIGLVTPQDGWIPKQIGGVLTYAMKEYAFYNGAPVINTIANTPDPATPLFWNFNFQRVGTYMIGVSFAHSYDATNSSVVVIPTLGGSVIASIANGEVLRKEPKDQSGNDGDGRGTSQKEIGGINWFPLIINSIGIQEFRLEHFGTDAGVEASIWNVSVIVEEIFNAQIKS